MQPFLKETLLQIVNKHHNDLSEITLIFNNRRPTLFVKHYLTELLGNTFLLPKTLVFDDLVSELGETELVPNEFLLFELYGIHRKVNPNDPRTLEQFMPMADMMLADFSEIDRYLVNVKDIYGNLHDLKEIGEWHIDGEKLTQFQKDYLHFYKSIHTYYTELNNLLDSRGQAYYGMAYRKVAENIDTILDNHPINHLYFLGFNALSKCEEKIIHTFIRRGLAEFIPDGDKYYMDDPTQEAGYFLRKHHYLCANKEFDELFAKKNKSINIVKVPDNVSQAKYAGTLLNDIASDDSNIQIAETALVLGDEGIITTVLNSLPNGIGQANITMGIPFTQTEMHSLALTVLSLYANSRISKYGSPMFYHKSISDVIGNKYISKLLEADYINEKTKKYLTERNVIYACITDLETMFSNLHGNIEPIRFLFEADANNPFILLETIKRLTTKIVEKRIIPNESKETAAIESLVQIIDYIEGLKKQVETYGTSAIPVENIQTLRKIYLRIAQRRSLSFIGKPLSGLQILGVLETRCLDFRRVILLSANEGVIPSSQNNNTLIPTSLKRLFGMPTYYEKDAVYAYNFYHLLQRAEEIYIVSSNDGQKDQESRFVQQLRAELSKKYSDKITVHELNASISNRSYRTPPDNRVEKSPEIMEQLRLKRYSPSSMNSYISCPLRFYYEQLLHLRQDDEISDTIESSDLGTIIHQCLEDIYKPFENKALDMDILAAEIDSVPSRIEKLLDDFFTNGEIHEGKTDLMRAVAISQVTHFLNHEIGKLKQGQKIDILQLEETLDKPLVLNIDGYKNPIEIHFNTKADRIDRINGQLRVVDYKSGYVRKNDISVKTLTPTEWQTIPAKWFQVMFYAWYYSRTHSIQEPMLSGLYPLQHLGGEFMPASIGDTTLLTHDVLSQFEQLMCNIFGEILDENIPLTSQPGNYCNYCSIVSVCTKKNDNDTIAMPPNRVE